MSDSSIWTIDRILSDATTSGKSGPGSDGSEGLLHIIQSSSMTGPSSSYSLMSYPGQSLKGFYFSAEIHSLYSAAPDDCVEAWMVL